MPRLRAVWRCQECGFSSRKWSGQCPQCEAWNAMAEEVEAEARPAPKGRRSLTEVRSELVRLDGGAAAETPRRPVGIGELDRLLGGGLVPGQAALLAGPPGIGKSTLMLQAAGALAASGVSVLYATGEESAGQVASRARRLGIADPRISLLAETDLFKIAESFKKLAPEVLIVDSVQTVVHPELAGSAGTVGQVRECASELLKAAKAADASLLLLGHVTKEGTLAGPKVLEHIVDTVIHFDADRHHLLRLLRVRKNRFGPTSEIGIFEMGEEGLREVADAGRFFLGEPGDRALAGRAISAALEGSRPILAEVQALAAYTKYPLPRRMATGLDLNRVQVLLAAAERHLKVRLESRDVFVALAGGVRLRDPALDLAVCAALLSTLRDAPLPDEAVFVGEVGLLGQVGRVPFLDRRLVEAERLGFSRAFVPKASARDLPRFKTMRVEPVEDLAALARAVGAAGEVSAGREPAPEAGAE